MRKLLFIISVFISGFVYSQTPQTSYVVTSIASMKTYFGNANRIHVTATNEDYVSCPTCTADEVTIYAGVSSRKWKKVSDLTKVDTGTALKFTLSSLRDNDLVKYDSVNTRFVNFRTTFLPPLSWNYLTGTASADTTTLATRAYVLNNSGTGSVTSVSGTTNRITSTGGTTPVLDISATFEALLGKVASPLSQFAATTSAQLAGNISDETGTGSLVFGTAPTFITNITTPLVIGGTSTTSDLFLQNTSGSGTTGADIHFLTGTNGNTEVMTILNNGFVGINQIAPSTYLEIVAQVTNAGIVQIKTATPASATSAGMQFQANRGSVGWDGTYVGMKIGTSDNGKPIVFGNSTTAGAGEYARFLGTGELGLGTTAPNSRLHTTSLATAYRAITALRTLDGTDNTIDCTSGTYTVTLPTAVGITGREYWITNTGSGTITIGTTSSQTFTNVTATPTTLTVAQFTNYKVVSTGANWLAYKIIN